MVNIYPRNFPLHLSDVFHKSLKVKKLSDVFTSLAEIQDGNYVEKLDVDVLVSKIKVRHIVPQLFEGTCWSSHSVNHFFGSSGAKDQILGH